ncbi:hypothetical protein [Rhodopirellula sp. P2]|uniref:hypothetical protein n=1 Tax=Rhodopirellula sp. P2 TaxID=2127060 RepID=UPI002367E74C|nr:hypothetical protein [Rhodopirellula sp. P2]WDQ17374.1 hypothetical protein PSR62_02190 [Rhodopirellula sp. P2]
MVPTEDQMRKRETRRGATVRSHSCLRIATLCAAWLVSLGGLSSFCRSAHGYTPEDPEIQALVDGGVQSLRANARQKTFYALTTAFTGGFGEHALTGYAAMKVNHDATDPVVQQGISSARTLVSKLGAPDPGGHSSKTVYAVSAAALLLAEVDAEKYKSELKQIDRYFRNAQYRNGAYGYVGEKTGDVSQTQYAMLALWTLDRAGIQIDYKGVGRTVGWLLRVQDPGGGWPYQGIDPGGNNRVKQGGVTPSMAVAGGSALLIGTDILRMWGESLGGEASALVGLPKAVKEFNEGQSLKKVERPKMPKEPVVAAIQACEGYLGKNSADPGVKKSIWPYYQLYTLERYESFREMAFDSEINPSPAWYNSGVEYLKEVRKGPSWPGGSYTTSSVSTAFSVLFLIRSTKRAIVKASSGTLAGGQGLPKDSTKIRREGSQIKGEPVGASVLDLLSALEDDGNEALEGKSLPEDMQLATDPKELRAQLDRLERLVRGSQSYQARRVAARLLGKSDDMRVVPALIYALSDPDLSVRRYARDGLRFISRKFEGFEMPDKPTEVELRKAERAWMEWYLTVNPKHVFVAQ